MKTLLLALILTAPLLSQSVRTPSQSGSFTYCPPVGACIQIPYTAVPAPATGSGGIAPTATNVTTAIQALTGCTTAGYVWSPATSTCVAPATGSAPTAANVAAAIQTLSGCTTAGYVWSPVTNTCVAQTGGSVTASSVVTALGGDSSQKVPVANLPPIDYTSPLVTNKPPQVVISTNASKIQMTGPGSPPSTLVDATQGVLLTLLGNPPASPDFTAATGTTLTANSRFVGGVTCYDVSGTTAINFLPYGYSINTSTLLVTINFNASGSTANAHTGYCVATR